MPRSASGMVLPWLVSLATVLVPRLGLAETPALATPPATGDRPVSMRLRSEPPGLSFHVLATTDAGQAWRPLCADPCRADVPAGTQTLGVAPPNGGPIVSAPALAVASEAKLVARFESRRTRRTAGWLAQLVGLGVGSALTLVTRYECHPAGPPYIPDVMFCGDTHPYLWPGIATAVVGLAVGIPLVLQHDQLTLVADPAN